MVMRASFSGLVAMVLISCAQDEGAVASNTAYGGSGGTLAAMCTPADEVVCLCYGAKNGSRTCQPDGSLSACPACDGGTDSFAAGAGGGSGGGCSETCSDGIQNCNESGVDCGGPCSACWSGVYTEDDCIKAARNGSEICDDAAWKVEAPGTGLSLVCLTNAGGIIYVSTNTGPPDPVDGVKRCQGWEKTGQNAWEHLNYVVTLQCDSEQQLLELDLSSYVGQTLYFGAHNHPAGGGEFTHMCLAKKK